MTPFLIAAPALAVLTLLPTAIRFARPRPRERSRREAALALHQAQLRELDRDAALGLVGDNEHAGARLEIERRLLAADRDTGAPTAEDGGRRTLAVALLVLPVAASLLYAVGGHPGWPADPLGPRLAAQARSAAAVDSMIARLREGLANLDPRSPEARAGRILLGNVEARLGRWRAASDAWQAALAAGFDPALADEAAEAEIRADGGRVSDEAASLLREAIARAPADAPWRFAAGARLAEKEHQGAETDNPP